MRIRQNICPWWENTSCHLLSREAHIF
jgi:hypothetical protein